MLSYLLFDEDLLKSVRNETNPAIIDGAVDLNYLMTQCPRLEAMINEVLRLTVSSQSTRRVNSPTMIGEKFLQPGAFVIIPYRQLHFNEEVFGEDAHTFASNRFLSNPSLSHHSSFRPFGGGTTYCPGRFFAKQEISTFVALVLKHYDIELTSATGRSLSSTDSPSQRKQAFPRLDDGKPALGALGPVKGDDLNLRMKLHES